MSEEQESDELLMARVAFQEPAAFEQLYDRYSRILFGYILKITEDQALAEEVLQESFWRVWRCARSFAPQRGSFRSWVFRIAHNEAINALRRQGSGSARAWLSLEADGKTGLPMGINTIFEATWQRIQSQRVRQAMRGLPPEQLRVIELAYFRGWTRQEIARATMCPLGTIHTRARLALRSLRRELLADGYGAD